MSELGDKVSDEIKAEVRAAMDEVKKVKDGEDELAIRKAVDALGQVVQKVGAAAYQAQPDAAPAGPETGSGEPRPEAGPDVVDGEGKGSE